MWTEWDAKRSVLFTPGNGMAALAAVQHEFPLLMLGLSGEHVQLLEYFVDCGVAMAMQVSGNRLYDKSMMAKVDRALEGNIDSEDETTPQKKKRKTDGKKGNKKSSSSDDNESVEEGTDEDESAEEDEV